jgi:hypothetical protein
LLYRLGPVHQIFTIAFWTFIPAYTAHLKTIPYSWAMIKVKV